MRKITHRLHVDRLAGNCLPPDSQFGVKVSAQRYRSFALIVTHQESGLKAKRSLLDDSFLDGLTTADEPLVSQAGFRQVAKQPVQDSLISRF